MQPDMSLATAIAILKKEIADKQAALAVLMTLVAPSAIATQAAPMNGTSAKGRRIKTTIGKASVEILRAAGRPMHGLREVLPALEAQGYKITHRAGLATTLLRMEGVERTAPGTFVYKGGDAPGH